MSFNLKVDEESAPKTFNKLMEEFDTFEAAMEERIKHLFKTHVTVSGPEKDAAYQQLLELFSIGYQCGWNDYKSLSDEKIIELNDIVKKQREALFDAAKDYDTWKKRINPFILQRLAAEILREYVTNPGRLTELSEECGIYLIKDDPMGVTIRFTKKEFTGEEKISDGE